MTGNFEIRLSEDDPDDRYDPGEVGAATDSRTLRLWRAHEAQRQGELRLSAQTVSISGIMGRSATLIGWTLTITLALSTASATAGHRLLMISAAMALASAMIAIVNFRPFRWGLSGDLPSYVLGTDSKPVTFETELEYVEALALRAQMDLDANNVRVDRAARVLLWSLILLGSAVASAALISLSFVF
ncbi:hypothetical protein AA103196_2295 [Ameyamaea chiangmaiensis NBRC 103196]|uniref:Uncharacterized protein n=1 Tax=Ameyamaea chiangmaiensis TaxID=442969 RepID=A0A850PAS9_9PROT|nr:hypothetical protein [Ameyamaea chiangmaiensis]MBS4075445.1 hypothetical protein [Ameyamaea chiangmaiensis]NVN39022.1 hypothetical protein [Ameyamaea chiangmaiensis]GBQ69736.1 hypothetical protein AA103196_2295 [Ameyamaea chiangmaiensis NBRC 103196]